MSLTLFDIGPGDVAVTTDDWYTPRWLFAAAGLMFDLDVAAPVDPAFRTCPARRYLTPLEDGLTAPWDGLVWCNPPYSKADGWVDRFVRHASGLFLGPVLPEVKWRGRLMLNADAIALLQVYFLRHDGSTARVPWTNLLAARGQMAVEALSRIAAADKYAAGAYHVRP